MSETTISTAEDTAATPPYVPGELVPYTYTDDYAPTPEQAEVTWYGVVVDVATDPDHGYTCRLAWLGGGVSGPIPADALGAAVR